MNKGIKTIKQWLFRTIFKKEVTEYEDSIERERRATSNMSELREQAVRHVADLEEQVEELTKIPKASLPDLMRDSLGLVRVDFANVNGKGEPTHPLDDPNKQIREAKIAELAMVFSNHTFKELIEYLINVQGNYSLFKSRNFDEDLAGRFSINGISMVYKELEKANALYEEAAKPPDSYDEHEFINRPNL